MYIYIYNMSPGIPSKREVSKYTNPKEYRATATSDGITVVVVSAFVVVWFELSVVSLSRR